MAEVVEHLTGHGDGYAAADAAGERVLEQGTVVSADVVADDNHRLGGAEIAGRNDARLGQKANQGPQDGFGEKISRPADWEPPRPAWVDVFSRCSARPLISPALILAHRRLRTLCRIAGSEDLRAIPPDLIVDLRAIRRVPLSSRHSVCAMSGRGIIHAGPRVPAQHSPQLSQSLHGVKRSVLRSSTQ